MGKEKQEYLWKKEGFGDCSAYHIVQYLIFFWKILTLTQIPGRTSVFRSLLSQPIGNRAGVVHQLLGYKNNSSDQCSFA